MCDFADFVSANPLTVNIRAFDEQELSFVSGLDVPEGFSDLLKQEGLSFYNNYFLSTTLPQWHFDTFSAWGLKGKECFAFMKTAFGSLFYINKLQVYRLDPLTGNTLKSNFDFCDFLNIKLTLASTYESCFKDIYDKYVSIKKHEHNEIFALVPALPLGGSFETSKYEVAKMREHISFLAQLYDNKVKKL